MASKLHFETCCKGVTRQLEGLVFLARIPVEGGRIIEGGLMEWRIFLIARINRRL